MAGNLCGQSMANGKQSMANGNYDTPDVLCVQSKSIMGTFSEPVAQHNISIALRTARQPNPIIISTKIIDCL